MSTRGDPFRSPAEHPLLNTRNFVLLAIAQVTVIVFSTLAAALINKILEGRSLPLLTLFYIHAGFILLLVPLTCVALAAWLRVRINASEESITCVFCLGILLLLFFFCFGTYAALGPLTRVTCGIGAD